MNQPNKVLLVLYYGNATTDYVCDRLGYCSGSVLSRLRATGFIDRVGHIKGYKKGMYVWGLTELGKAQANLDIDELSVWGKIKLFLGILSI